MSAEFQLGSMWRPYLEFASILIVRAIVIHQIDELQVVSLTTLEIVGVVGGRNLDGTGTEFHVDSDGIRDNGDSAAIEGMNDEFAMEVLVSRIIRVNGDGSIAQHCLRTCRGNDDLLV